MRIIDVICEAVDENLLPKSAEHDDKVRVLDTENDEEQ